jgi:hypothetical protein
MTGIIFGVGDTVAVAVGDEVPRLSVVRLGLDADGPRPDSSAPVFLFGFVGMLVFLPSPNGDNALHVWFESTVGFHGSSVSNLR